MAKRRKNAPVCETLEPRILYSADMLPLPVDPPVTGEASSPLGNTPSVSVTTIESVSNSASARAEIPAAAAPAAFDVFVVDTTVQGTDALIEDLVQQRRDGRAMLLITAEEGDDAIAAVSAGLAGMDGEVSAIHFIGHGDETGMQLGGSRIDLPTLRARAAEFSLWSQKLTENADLLLYGCDLASTPRGMSIVDGLAALTGADVAASVDLTGAASRGGDWDLEYTVGVIESASAFTIETQQSWNGVLANYVVSNTNDSGAGSLRQAITNANLNPGADTIQFAIAGGGVQTINLLSALPVITDQVTIDGYTQPGAQANTSYNSDNATLLIQINGIGTGIGADGLRLSETADGSLIRGLVINRFDGFGIVVSGLLGDKAENITIAGNFIGTDTSGTSVVGLGNRADGIGLYDTVNAMIGGAGYAARNLIAGNGTLGNNQGGINLGLRSSGATILNNYIGVSADGSTVLGNAQYGILADQGANNSVIGHISWPDRNLIAGAVNGIEVANNGAFSTQGINIISNSIWGNSGLSIDLGASGYDGVTPNDSGDGDSGPNGLQNFPVITAAYTNNTAGFPGVVYVSGTYAGMANEWYIIDLYADTVADPSGHGEARIPLGRAWYQADGAGNVSFTASGGMGGELPALPAGTLISATATRDATGDTSELSQNRASLLGNLTVTTTNDTVNGDISSIVALITTPGADGISLREAILASNNTPPAGIAPTITFNIAGGGPHTITPTSALPLITNGVTMDATSQPGYAGAPLIRIDGSLAGAGGVDGLRATDWAYVYGLSVTNFSGDGLQFDHAGSLVTDSYLGVAPDGSAAGNAGYGVVLLGDNSYVGAYWGGNGNLISDNDLGGVLVSGSSVQGAAVIRNRIGTNAAGTAALGTQSIGVTVDNGANNVQVGRSNSGEGNLISGNTLAGVRIDGEATDGNSVRNNIIGLNTSANAVIGTGDNGVWATGGADNLQIGGTAADEGNQIGGASRRGIELWGDTSGVIIEGNAVGTNFAGNLDLGNTWEGIYLGAGANSNRIGGTVPSASNRIAFNGLDGIRLQSLSGNGNTFYGNRIYDNDGLGIDLQVGALSSIVTTNDAGDSDTGVNNLQNFPVITRFATNQVSTIWINGTLESTPNTTFRIEYFFSSTVDPSGYGEGATYWSFLNVTTNSSGQAMFFISSSAAVPTGTWLTATATNLSTGDTSEFSAQVAAVLSTPIVTTSSSTLAFVENDPATAVDPGVLVTDQDSTNLGSATVSISNNYVNGQDTLAFTDQLGITGSWNAALGVLTLSGSSSVANYQTALRSITYVNTSENPSTAQRTVSFRVNDGVSNSNVATRDVSVTAVADHLITVDTTSDVSDGDISSIDTLLANQGADGFISLREAISAANNTTNGAGGADQINFAIAGAGVHLINLVTQLPDITDAVVIDASTDDSFAANGNAPAIILDGNNNFTGDGLVLTSTADGSTIRGFVIRDFSGDGIRIQAGSDGHTIAGNYIGGLTALGTDAGGAESNTGRGVAVFGANVVIGGATAGDRNLISGNGGTGILIDGENADGNKVWNNWLGVASGSVSVPNGGDGISINNGADGTVVGGAGIGNWIADASDGIEISGPSVGTVIQGNRIGTDLAGTANWGMNFSAISIEGGASNALIGGVNPGEGNIIAFNGFNVANPNGISIWSDAGPGHAILGNSIYSNVGRGIDLNPNGVTANDPGDSDTGPNDLQNYPVLTGAVSNAGNTTITGSINSNAGTTYRIEFFSSPIADATGYGEGAVYLGSTTVTTDGSGNAAINAVLTGVTVTAGHVVTATATVDLGGGNYGSTSEFAQNVVATASLTISGTVFEDVNGNGAIADDGVGLANAVVSLYRDDGNGTPDAADTVVNVLMANALGQYGFSGLTPGVYWVVADSRSFIGSAGLNGGFTIHDQWAEQTYGSTGSVRWDGSSYNYSAGAGAMYGGLRDDRGDNGASLPTAEHMIRVTLVGSDRPMVDFGFSYNVISNTRDGDEVGPNNRTIQGSLRQFVQNANALTGVQSSRFVIAGSGIHTISPSTALPPIIDAVTLDASTDDSFAANGNRPAIVLDGNDLASDGLLLNVNSNGSTVRGLVIRDFGSSGIYVYPGVSNITIAGNYLGRLDTDGNDAGVGEGNAVGLYIDGSSNLIGGNAIADTNIIAGNSFDGVVLSGNANTVQGNWIGTNALGATTLGNSEDGLSVSGSNNLIGGVGAGQGNVFSGNVRHGIDVWAGGIGNAILGNSMWANGGLAIGLGSGGVNPNDAGDADIGENSLQNFPVLSAAVTTGTQVTIAGALNSMANTQFRIEFFASAAPDVSGHGEGERYLGFLNVTTDGAGDVSFGTTLTTSVAIGEFVSATATRSNATFTAFTDTSAFSQNIVAAAPVNAAPVIAGLDGDVRAFTEGGGAMLLGSTSGITDVDSADFDTGTLTASFTAGSDASEDVLAIRNEGVGAGQIGVSGASITYGGVVIGSWAGGTGGASLVVTLNANADLISTAALINNLTYNNTDNNNPTPTTRIIRVVLSDGDGGTSTNNDTTMTVAAVNDQPAFINLNGTPTFTEGGAAVVLDSDAQVFDPELSAADNFNGATLTLVRNGGANNDDQFAATGTLSVLSQGGGLVVGGTTIGTVTLNSGGTLLLTFNSSATNARVNSAIQQIAYANSSSTPPVSVQINWTFNDDNGGAQGSGGMLTAAGSTTVAITALDNTPAVTTTVSALTYTENNPPTATDSGLIITDLDSTNLASAVISIGANYVNGQDLLVFANQLGITGSWNSAAGVLNLSGVSSVGNYQTALRSVSYLNVSENPSIAARTITFVVNDGAFTSNPAIRTINVSAVNDAPVFTAGDGIVTTQVGLGDTGEAVLVQPDGKLLVAGTSGSPSLLTVTRYNTDGSLDTSFGGGDGIYQSPAVVQEGGFAMTLQADGRILLTGFSFPAAQSDLLLIRLNSDGSPDVSFGGGDGVVTTDFGTNEEGKAVAVQPDGKILVGGYAVPSSSDFLIARYNTDGTLDTGFGTGGVVFTSFGGSESDVILSMVLQPDGKIVASGQGGNFDLTLARYNPDGSLDASFGASGLVTTNTSAGLEAITGLVIQPDGKLVAGGYSDGNMVLVRYNNDGSLDTSLGGTGIVVTSLGAGLDQSFDLALQADGKYVLVGRTDNGSDDDIAVLRFNTDGSLDTSFGGGDGVVTATGLVGDLGLGIVIQMDGKIVVSGLASIAGDNDIVLLRYNPDGSVDTRFGSTLTNTLNGAPTFVEGGPAVVLDADVLLFDAELSVADNFTGATMTLARNGGANAQDVYSASGTLSALLEGGSLVVGGTTIGTVTSNSSGSLLLTFDGGATNALINSALRQIAYSNSSEAPPASVQINWTFNDGNAGGQGSGGALTVLGSTTITIAGVNDAPVVTTTGSTLAYAENSPATVIDAGLIISDVDHTNLVGATVSVTGNYANGEDILAFTNQLGITGSWNVATGVLTLSGVSSVANYQAALRSVTYLNVSENPSTALRTIAFIVDDSLSASGVVTRDITVSAVNDAPVFVGLDGTPAFIEGGVAVVLDSNVTMGDAELSAADNFDGATLTLMRNGGANSDDLFSASGTLSALTGGGALVVGGTTIGSVSSNSGGVLALTFNSSATTALVNLTMQQIAYVNASSTPPASAQVNWNFNDGNTSVQGSGGALSTTGSISVTITPVSDPPVLTAVALAVNEGQTVTLAPANISITDPDSVSFNYTTSSLSGGYFQLTSSPGVPITSFTSADLAGGLVQFVDDGDEIPPAFSLTANDGVTNSNTLAAAIVYTLVNDAPSDLVRVPAIVVPELSFAGTSAGVVVPIDPDDTSGFVFSLAGGASGFMIDPVSGALSVASAALPAFDVQSSYQIVVSVADPAGAIITRTFTIQVARQPMVAPPPSPSETGQKGAPSASPSSSSGTENSANTPVVASASPDTGTSGRERQLIALDNDDPNQRRRAATQFDGVRGGKRAEVSSGRIIRSAEGMSVADEQITLQLVDAKGEVLLKRGYSGSRLFELLRLEHQRYQSESTGEWGLPALNLRSPGEFIDWVPESKTPGTYHVQVETIQLGGAALSIGLIFYALRAGGLIAAMLTALPAWSSMDPLVVLAKDRDQQRRDWGDEDDQELDRDEDGVRKIIGGSSTVINSTRVLT